MSHPKHLACLRQSLADWFADYARPLPWRERTDAYAIWLSEIILQQTQVVQGMSYYHRFLDTYPTIQDLAAASEDEVLRLWQGLGYYSRGRNLLKAARMVVDEYGGEFPRSLAEIKRLPGVGPYTQAAVLSFAYDLPHAAVDGNVYRVVSRLYADDTPIDTPMGQKHFRMLAEELLDRNHPGRHNQAMIELGALVCSPRRPGCNVCPIASHCSAQILGIQTHYPIKQGKTKVTERYMYFMLIELPIGEILIERRGAGDIWQGLYQLPLIETATPIDLEELLSLEAWHSLEATLVSPRLVSAPVARRQHRLTHRLLHATLYRVQAEGYTGTRYQRIDSETRAEYGMPALIDKLLASETASAG